MTEEIAGWAELRQSVHIWVELDQPRRLRLVWIENQSPLEAAMAAMAAVAAMAAMAGLLALVAAVDYEQKIGQRSLPNRWLVLEPPAVVEEVVLEAEVAADC